MNNPLKPLRTEILFSTNRSRSLTAGRKQHDLNKSVDRLVEQDRGPWDSEHRRQHDALLARKVANTFGILTVLILTITAAAALGL